MFTKFDKWFAETAADPARRRAAIADYSKRRVLFFWLAVVSSVLALAAIIVFLYSASKPGEAGGMAAFIFSPIMIWMIGMKIDSDLRILKMYDQFYKDREDSHVA
jgi:hypothetical protein